MLIGAAVLGGSLGGSLTHTTKTTTPIAWSYPGGTG